MKKASKFLSLILRHRPEAGDITLDTEGWADVSAVMSALRFNVSHSLTRTDLDVIVSTNEKQRFAFNERRDKIRANQGHSVEVDLGLEQKQPPALLYHGTKADYVCSILKYGLTPQKRQHVHLSPDIETAHVVASRRKGRPILVTIDTSLLPSHRFFESANGVWLTDSVPSGAITISYPWEA